MANVISLVSYPFLPAKVGGQKGVALFNKYFSRYHKLICVTTKKNDPTAAEGYEVMNTLSNSKFRYINIFYFFTIRKIIREKKATHLIIEHPYYGWLGMLLKLFCRIKLVVHSHNMEGLRWKTLGKWWWLVLWFYEKVTHRCADYNFFIHDEDKKYAIDQFRLKPSRCITVTYGIEWENVPSEEERKEARQVIRGKHKIDDSKNILLFNGTFNYMPNIEGLQNIVAIVNPILQQKNFSYTLVICGRDIPESISKEKYPDVIFAGFVDDISLYFKGANTFLNPISKGGGIKTKLVEALGYNLNSVSTQNGAIGINPDICNGKLLICGDYDWGRFAGLIIDASHINTDTPSIYFEHFYWGSTAKRAAEFIESKPG